MLDRAKICQLPNQALEERLSNIHEQLMGVTELERTCFDL